MLLHRSTARDFYFSRLAELFYHGEYHVEENRPNLLYIHSDQHNPYVTGCYGDSLVDTPHLDALAVQGVTLENTYCP